MVRTRAQQTVVDAVLLSIDHQPALLDALGLHGLHLAQICKAWRTAVAERRGAWELLRHGTIFGGSGEIHCPSGVAALPNGSVCVAELLYSRLKILSRQPGEVPRIIGRRGDGPGQFRHPFVVAFDDGALFVCDTNNDRVQKLRLADGAPLGSVGTEGRGDGQFCSPRAVCVAAGLVYVCDCKNHRIVVLSTDLVWRYTFGRQGSDGGEFATPAGVVGHGDEIFVVDQDNNRIQAPARPLYPLDTHSVTHRCLAWQVFSPGGDGRLRFRRVIGSAGTGPGQFLSPRGVAVVRGLLIVSGSARLQVLTLAGVPLQVVQFDSPLSSLSADEHRVLAAARVHEQQVHELLLLPPRN